MEMANNESCVEFNPCRALTVLCVSAVCGIARCFVGGAECVWMWAIVQDERKMKKKKTIYSIEDVKYYIVCIRDDRRPWIE